MEVLFAYRFTVYRSHSPSSPSCVTPSIENMLAELSGMLLCASNSVGVEV